MKPARRLAAAGVAYFLLVFAAGFVLGVVRTLWVVPVLGERGAELLEMPFMLLASYLAARWVVGRFDLRDQSWGLAAGVGLLALGLLLAVELGVVLRLRGLTIGEYLGARDPVSGAVYAASLVVFAVLPAILARGTRAP